MQGNRTQRVTMRDIAQKTGYSVNTVSKALRDMPDLSGQTKEHIQTVAREMGYVTNDMASALRSGYSNVLALIISDISNPFFGILCKEVEQQAAKYNYTVIVFNTEEDAQREERAIRTALSKNVDGVLLTPSQHSTDGITLLQDMGKPCVLIGRYFSDVEADAVLFDDENGGFLAGKHLLDCGCRNILMLNAPDVSSARDREKGFLRAMEQAPDVRHRIVTLESALGGVEAVLSGEYRREKFDAVFAYSDLLGMEVASVLEDLGIGTDSVAIVGFDDIQSRLPFTPGLTSVSVGKAAFGEALVTLLMKRITGDSQDFPSQIVLPTKLVLRKSTQGREKETC